LGGGGSGEASVGAPGRAGEDGVGTASVLGGVGPAGVLGSGGMAGGGSGLGTDDAAGAGGITAGAALPAPTPPDAPPAVAPPAVAPLGLTTGLADGFTLLVTDIAAAMRAMQAATITLTPIM